MAYRELRSITVRCRKRHQCSWCGETIEKGEESEARTYVFNGDLISDHQHLECTVAMMCCEDIPPDGWLPGDYLRGSTEWA